MRIKYRVLIVLMTISLITIYSFNTYAGSLFYNDVYVCVNDETAINGIYSLKSYVFDDYNYFKLRDLACLLKSTTSQFDVGWNKNLNMIEIETGSPYEGEYEQKYFNMGKVTSNIVDISIDGTVHRVNSYNVDGNSYFKLRDLADLLDFRIELMEGDSTVYIY